MPRKPRILTDSGLYHIVTRGNNRQSLFRRDDDFKIYLDLIRTMKSSYEFHLYHYCLMTNHTHLLMRFFDHESFQKVMQRINLTYAKRYRKEYHYYGHVFQDRFKSFPIEQDSYLLECGRYIERNPLKAGMVKDLADYAWSSYSHYAVGKANDLITDNLLYEDLGSSSNERQLRYREYLAVDRPYEQWIAHGLTVSLA